MQGVEEFLQVFDTFTTAPSYPDVFGAKVYKIARDPSGTRLTYLKITGGTLKVKDILRGRKQQDPEETWEEKVHQIRIYSGASYQAVEEASVGMVLRRGGTGFQLVRGRTWD